MAINIVCVGKIKEKFYRDALSEYIKRLGRVTKVNVVEVDEELLEGNNIDKVITREGERILAKVKGYMVLMDIGGELVTSEDIARGIKDTLVHESNITFVIGGSYGDFCFDGDIGQRVEPFIFRLHSSFGSYADSAVRIGRSHDIRHFLFVCLHNGQSHISRHDGRSTLVNGLAIGGTVPSGIFVVGEAVDQFLFGSRISSLTAGKGRSYTEPSSGSFSLVGSALHVAFAVELMVKVLSV